jgi:hypothetical protein
MTGPSLPSGSGQQVHSPASDAQPMRAFITTEKSVSGCGAWRARDGAPCDARARGAGALWSQLIALACTFEYEARSTRS